jgi:hypothetical protein
LPTISIGAGLSAAFRPLVRVPVTITSLLVSACVCAMAAPAASDNANVLTPKNNAFM